MRVSDMIRYVGTWSECKVGRKRAGGYVFVTYKGDHPPLHVHIFKNQEFIGRWDIEHQCPMDVFRVSRNLRRALRLVGYLLENGDDD